MTTGRSLNIFIGVAILGAAAISLISLLASNVQAADTNANVNINDDAPFASGHIAWQDPEPYGDPVIYDHTTGTTVLTGIVNGSTRVIVNLNVTDTNGYAGSNINVRSRLFRTKDNGTNVQGVFNSTSGDTTYILPSPGPTTCTDIATISPTEHTWNCVIESYYNTDPTEPGSSVNASTNFAAEHWIQGFRIKDDNNIVDDLTTLTYEWPQIVGLTLSGSPLIDLGTVTTDGTAGADGTVTVQNKGNQEIDAQVRASADTDSAVWSCTGSGNPLISDLHLGSADIAYGLMNVLPTNSAGDTQLTGFDLPRGQSVLGPSAKDVHAKFATIQAVTPGTCTLSSVILSAIKGY